MIDCREVLAELGNDPDDQAAVEIRRELEEHLAHCRTCHVLVDSTRKTVKIVTECRSFELPVDLSSRIMARIRAATGEGGEVASRQ